VDVRRAFSRQLAAVRKRIANDCLYIRFALKLVVD
jgi:hypothetical protein